MHQKEQSKSPVFVKLPGSKPGSDLNGGPGKENNGSFASYIQLYL